MSNSARRLGFRPYQELTQEEKRRVSVDPDIVATQVEDPSFRIERYWWKFCSAGLALPISDPYNFNKDLYN